MLPVKIATDEPHFLRLYRCHSVFLQKHALSSRIGGNQKVQERGCKVGDQTAPNGICQLGSD